jgi:5-hydroxyisourate hydrolase-like protein (transthyretin family)
MKLALAFLCAAGLLTAAVDGVVVNRTTGKPQPGVEVVLTTMGAGGMQPASRAVTGPDGRFRIEGGTDSAHLLQAVWQGVSYNRSLQQGASNVEIEIYDALPRVSAAEIAQHMILVETDGQEIVVNETIVMQNDSLTTWNDPKGGVVRVYVPEAAGEQVRARVVAPGGVPVERQPRRAGPPNVWTLDAPVKPGETRFDFSYKLPAGEKSQLSSRILHDGKARLIVPDSINAIGDNLKLLGAEPSISAAIFEIEKPAFTVTLTGTGSLRAASGSGRTPGADDGAPRLQTIQPPGYQRSWVFVLALGGIILLLGFSAQYIKGAPDAGGKRRA